MNFLYQASLCVLPSTPFLSRYYVTQMKEVAMKNVVRLDKEIKRTICKGCCGVLVPGWSSTVRVEPRRQSHVVVKCASCGTVKRFNNQVRNKKQNRRKREELTRQMQDLNETTSNSLGDDSMKLANPKGEITQLDG
eukprot:TRINITY_DN7836_c0_g1_i1.p1 TRINITY_DN7836_c0_g1~~TRINITY_DN7836_c0_g1_i1.p1  ORF type:complete len:136 (+),score=11.00 TRINITY_DN7836_c0_g1_i1:122-529(+)